MIPLPELMIGASAVTAAVCALAPRERTISPASIAGSAVVLAAALAMAVAVGTDGPIRYGPWYIDGLSTLFSVTIAVVSLAVSMYSRGYLGFERREGILTTRGERYYYAAVHSFAAVMLLTCTVSSLGMMWIMIEATTLISAFLVGYYRNEQATEAAWKYIMICSVGITLALMGLMLVYASASGVLGSESGALDWPVLMAAASMLDPELMKVAMVFAVIGFGTKMGLAPMHTWLPDAHSQAPTPVSAMLSAALLNCALYAILRFMAVSDASVPGFSGGLLMMFGFASLAAAAAFIIITRDIKRMLAYSSVEHMGIMAIGFGMGTPESVFGALFLVVAHSATKALLFFSAGNAIQAFGTRDMDCIRGMGKRMPFTSSMMASGTLAIVGMPPFSVFVGEAVVLYAAVSAGLYLQAALLAVLVLTVFAGFVMHVFPMISGEPEKEVREPGGMARAAPMVMLLGVSLFLGLFMPDQMRDWLESAATAVLGGV